jgi:glutamate-1-semialdehyde aminotransferase/NAD(P)-dependent dehydrogenase (short-subunit alcohol dehydrogenase family)
MSTERLRAGNRVASNRDYPVIAESDRWWERARGLIPAGTQTLAKGPGQFVAGVAPKYLRRGRGCHVWDVDGNEYLDMSMAVGPLILGYAYPAVDGAIKRQLEDGITFSLMHPLEVELAERLRECVPCAESVRFSKTGADVTSAAVRVARAVTGRSRVLCCGYHGWHDWYVAVTDRARGVPPPVRDLSYTFDYNHLDSLDAALDRHVACVILEPVVFEEPKAGFLQGVRDRCTANGSILVFDEMWTGFRLALGGAQAHYGVTPDLATFSKAIANGMPLSVLAGRADLMAVLEREVFFFTTFGGEALSLAAALATLHELDARQVPAYLAEQGSRVKEGYSRIARELGMEGYTRCVGPAARSLVVFDRSAGEPLELKSLLQQELLKRGVLWSGTNTLSFSHREDDLAYLLTAYREALAVVGEAVEQGRVRQALRGAPVEPVFRRTGQFHTRPRPAGDRERDTFSLEGRVAVVTGAAGLLGRQHAAALSQAGASVVLMDTDVGGLGALAAELEGATPDRVIVAQADVTDPAALVAAREAALRRFGRLDILVNNAALDDKVEQADGDPARASLESYPLDHWRRMIEVNVTGVFLASQVFGAEMVRRREGSIINLASTYGLVGPDPALYVRPDGTRAMVKSPAYPTSKGAVIALTRSLAAHFGGSGVRVNALAPGGVRNGQESWFVEKYSARTPLGRMAAPQDYRGAIVFLASDASRYMTGAVLVVDGGFSAW